jgi:hypothetical protein
MVRENHSSESDLARDFSQGALPGTLWILIGGIFNAYAKND